MDCNQCGKPIKRTDDFCPHCDALQNPSPSPAPPELSSETTVKNEVVELVRRAMGGDDSVWGEVYEKTHRYVYFMALKFLRSEQDAQDITQEVYIQAIRSVGQLYSADSFFGWLRTIIYSKCKNFVKKKKPALLEDEATGWLENMPEIDDTFLPDMTLDSAESRRMILELIDALPYQQRQTVLFYYYDEMTIDQIATLMECPAGTVKSRLNYARQQIKNGVEEHERKGVKLYGIATLPILTLLLRGQAEAMPIPSALGSSVAPIIQGIGVPSSAVPGATVAYNTTVTSGTSTVALSTKIILCVLAAVIVIGGGMFVWMNSGNGDYTEPPVVTVPPTPTATPGVIIEPDDEPVRDYLAYFAPVLAEYRATVMSVLENPGEYTGSSLFLPVFDNRYGGRDAFGFALTDLNGDGVPELILLTEHYSILAIYSLFENTPHELGVFSARVQADIFQDGTIHVHSNDGWDDARTLAYRLAPDGGGLLLLGGVGFERDTQSPDGLRHFRVTIDNERITISEAEMWAWYGDFDDTFNTWLSFIPLFGEENGETSP